MINRAILVGLANVEKCGSYISSNVCYIIAGAVFHLPVVLAETVSILTEQSSRTVQDLYASFNIHTRDGRINILGDCSVCCSNHQQKEQVHLHVRESECS